MDDCCDAIEGRGSLAYSGNDTESEKTIDFTGYIKGLGTNYELPDGMIECDTIEGFYRHCVNSCKLGRVLSPLGVVGIIVTQVVAISAGNDWTNSGPSSSSDRRANIAGNISSYNIFRSCVKSCKVKTKEAIEKNCCPYKGLERYDKRDPKCCPPSTETSKKK